jgi:hypothetical protein
MFLSLNKVQSKAENAHAHQEFVWSKDGQNSFIGSLDSKEAAILTA